MTSMNRLSFIILLIAALSACNNDDRQAALRLENARQMNKSGSYNAAKLQIDSIRSLYPKSYPVIKEAIILLQDIELNEQTRNLSYCDSILTTLDDNIAILKQSFILEKDARYQRIGNWMLKSQKAESNLRKSYIRTGVNEWGEMYITSVYFGKSALKHTAIRMSTPDGGNAETVPVAPDGGNNYSFTDNGMVSEIVSYRGKKCRGVVGFVSLYETQPIKVEYLNGKSFSLTLDSNTKKAIIETAKLAESINEYNRFVQERELARAKISLLKQKIAKRAISKQD